MLYTACGKQGCLQKELLDCTRLVKCTPKCTFKDVHKIPTYFTTLNMFLKK